MFYDVYCALCEKNGLTPSGAAYKIGFNRASVTVWKNTGKAPKQELLLKIADFFGVTTDYLLTGDENKKAPTQEGEREIDDRKMKAAFLGGLADGLSEEEINEYWDDARDYIGYKIQQKRNKPD